MTHPVYLTPEEISFLMNELHYEHNEGNFEPDCPSCTAYRKLAATKPTEDEIREAMQASTQDTVPAWADDVLRRAALSDEVIQLLNHIEDVVGDEAWARIDAKLWNAVTKLAYGVDVPHDTKPTPQRQCACGNPARFGWHGPHRCQHSPGVMASDGGKPE